MKKNKRFFAAAICTLLSVLFVFSANVLASEVSITERADSYYERVADSGYEDSGGWIDRDEYEYKKDEYEQEYKEKAEEGDEEHENAPSDPEDDVPAVQEDEYM